MESLGLVTKADACKCAADKLHSYLCENHLREDGALVGPDVGARWNIRVGRFIKSYLGWVNWGDRGIYLLQGQGYWILANMDLFGLTGDEEYLWKAIKCADVIVSKQTADGCWLYENLELKNRIATVEGCFAALALLAIYKVNHQKQYFESANKWFRYMIHEVGFQDFDSESKALNYWACRESAMVPNNSTLGLWLAAEMASATGSTDYLDCCPPMISFLKKCQLPTGEFPYALYADSSRNKIHYLCYQYHAFQFLDMAYYYKLTGDNSVWPLMEGVASFLTGGVSETGESRNDCFKSKPGVIYYTAAIAAALNRADKMGLGNYRELSDRAYNRVISHQKQDGSFIFSYANYWFLSDKRSYPRSQAMILRHLLSVCESF